MILKRLPRVIALSACLGLVWAAVATPGPGTGSAGIAPPGDVVAGTSGEWTITYTAAEVFDAGTLRLTIPAGWTAPQTSSATSAGYVTVTTNEPAGNPLLSVGGNVLTVTVDTLSVGNTITIVYGDDSSGTGARATAATDDGPYTFLVESDPLGASPTPIAASPSLDVVAAAPAYLAIVPSDTTMTAGDFAPYRLFVFDAFGNRSPVPANRTVNLYPGHGQFYLPADHGTPIPSVVIPAGQSTVPIDYRGTLATGGMPHSLVALTLTGSPQLGGSADVHIVAGPLDPTNSLVSATSPVVADGVAQSSVVVTSRDAYDNPRQGDTVVLAVDGNASKVDPVQPTGTNGQAIGAVTNTAAQLVTVSATINGLAITPTAQVTFQAGPVNAGSSTVDATTPVVANGVATSTITVTARDANGNAVSGQNVALSVAPPGNGVLTQPGGVTNAAGQVTGTLTSTVPGPRTVTATVGVIPVTDNAVVQFNPGPLASFQWTVDGSAVAGVGEPVTLRARDAQGNTVTNYTGTVTLSTTSGGVGDGVVQWGSAGLGTITNLTGDDATYQFAAGDNGLVTLTLTDERAESILLTAQDGAAGGTSGAILVAANVAADVALEAGNGQSATVNTPVTTLPLVRVLDSYGNPVAGQPVTFRVITTVTGVGSVDVTAGGGVDTTGTTDSNGYVDCDVWRLGTAAGPNRLRALISSGSSVDFTATGTAGNGTNLVLAPGSKSVTVNAFEVVTATLTDAFNNPKSGTRVDIAITNVDGGTLESNPAHTTTQLSPTARWGNTDAAGQITVRFRAPGTAGLANTVDASTSTIGQGSVTDAVYTTTASGATNLRITFLGPATADAGQTFAFEVEAVDGAQNVDATNASTVTLTPEAASTLVFSETDFGGPVTQVTLTNGQKTVYGRGTKTGDWDIGVSGGGLGPDTDTVSITDTGFIDHYLVSTVPSVVAGVTFNVFVEALDVYDNRVVDASNVVNLQAIDDVTTNPALATLLVGQTTLAGGVATQSETYPKAEAIRVRATASGKNGTSGILTVSAASAYRIAKVSGDNTGVAVGSAQPLVAQVFDAFDNPVANVPVTFVVLGGGGNVAPPSDDTDATGTAQTTLMTGTVPGNNLVKAVILDENPTGLERVDYLVETVAGGIDHFTVVPAKLNPIAGEPVQVMVTAFDAEDNPVTGDNTTQIQLMETGSAQLGAAAGTLTDGTFTTTVIDTLAESFTITATRQGGGPTGTSNPINVTHAGAYQVVKINGDASGVTAGATQPLEVEVRDEFGNVVPGQPVTFAVASSPGGATITDAVGDPGDGITTTNGAGRAQATLTTSVVAGANLVNAQILDGPPPSHERVTFTVDTQSSAAVALRITFLGPTTALAGQTLSFKVDALDAGQNVDTANNGLVTLAPEAGSTLLFSLTDFGASLTQFNLVNGTRTIYVRGTKAGTWDITADDGAGGMNPDTDTVNITDTGAVDHYAVTAPSNATAGVAFNVSIEARDVYDNKVIGAGNLVNLVAVQAADSLQTTGVALSVTQATLVGGAVVVNESYTRAEAIRVRARDAGTREGFSGAVQVGASAAFRVVNVTGNPGGVVAGQTQGLTARVLDLYDNPVFGQLVSFSVQSGGGGVAPPSALTNAAGNASTTLTTGVVVGPNVARAQILDGNPPAQEQATFTVTTIAGPIANYLVTTDKSNLVADEVTNVTARARDANNNTVTQDNTTIVTLSATGSATLGAPSGQLAAGLFTTTVKDQVAETFTVRAESGASFGDSPIVTVTSGPAYRIEKVTADVNGLPVETEQPLVSIVRDQWGNPVAGATVIYLIDTAPAGAALRDTVNTTTDGITTSEADGEAVAYLGTAPTAGLNRVTATINDGPPPTFERVSWDVNTVAGGIAYYEVEMGGVTTAVAGTPVPVTISAFDGNDNPVDDDVTQVDLSGDPGVGLVFGTDPVTLSNGTAVTTVTATQVQTFRVRASTLALPAVTGLGTQVSVTPAAPAGTITATASANPITANGVSTTTVTSGVIRDAFGNQVPAGLLVNVDATAGTIIGGNPRTIDMTGRIQFELRSSVTPTVSTVTMTSVTGTASGSIQITFAPPVAFACNAIPIPSIVVPGTTARFRVVVENSSATDANLNTATTFAFSDGPHAFSAALVAPKAVAAGDTATLVFATTAIDPAFASGYYQPVIGMIGTDEFASPFSVPCALPAQSVLMTSIEITAITPPPVISRGQSTTIAVQVRNNGAEPTTIDDVTLSFIPGTGLFSQLPAPELGLEPLTGGATRTFNVPVTVLSNSDTGTYQIDAFAEGTVNGKTVTDNSFAPNPLPTWVVQTEADLAYVAGTLAPVVVSRGKTYMFQMSIRNDGAGVVALDTSQTRITFTDGVRTYSAAPVQPYAIAGGATQPMLFKPKGVPALFTLGSYEVVLDAHGTENGAPFEEPVVTGPGALSVVTPASVTLAAGNALTPDQVTKGSTATFFLQLNNAGGATVVLTPATTTLSFAGGQFTATLNPAGPTTLPPGLTTLQFNGMTVAQSIAAGNYTPQVQLTGTENGLPFSQGFATQNVLVENAPAIAINAILPSQVTFTTDQFRRIQVRMVVSNTNGADVTFTSASIRFFDAALNRTNQFAIVAPAGFSLGNQTLGGGETDTLVFQVSDNGGAMSPGNLTIEGNLLVEDVNSGQPIAANTDLGGKGSLLVQTPASIAVLAITPAQPKVTQGMAKDFRVRVLLRNNGQSAADLATAAATLTFNPQGAGWQRGPLAQLGGGGTVLSGGEVDTLIFNVTQSGSIAGNTTIDAAVNGTETNSGRDVVGAATGLGAIVVQTPGVIAVTSVVSSRPTITSGAGVPWTLTVNLENTGQADVDLALGNAVEVTFPDATAAPVPSIPPALAGGGTLLSGGEVDQLVISMPTAGTYAPLGPKLMGVDIDGVELNSNLPKNGTGAAGVTVQAAPSLAYVSVTPGVVSKGAEVEFSVAVTNPVVNGATIALDPAQTSLRFAGGAFTAPLAQAVNIAAGQQVILLFDSAPVAGGIPSGPQNDAELVLGWTANGVSGGPNVPVTDGDIVVQNAPDLNIVSIRPSQATVTRQQSLPWSVTMVVRNQGGAAVDLDLGAAATRLQFNLLGGGTNVTGEYTIVPPAGLESAGGTLLAGATTDSLVFGITPPSGVTAGTVIVSGFVEGTDQNSQLPVSDNTADGGTGSFVLQVPAALNIASITPAQTTATVGQTGAGASYKVRMAVTNTGGADVDLTLSAANTFLTFPNSAGWAWSVAPALAGGGVTLSGGETDTVTFTITTTGSPAVPATIGGTVAGIESNTGLPVGDDTVSGGAGSILLQTPAVLVVNSVTPSRTNVTANTNVGWDVMVSVTNTGQSMARLSLPGNLSTAVQSSTGGTVFGPAVALQEGGVDLAGGASGTLVVHTNATGTFSAFGPRNISVTVSGVEMNSDRPLGAPGQGTIDIETAPNLAIVSFEPTTVTAEASAGFRVQVANADANAATATLDRGTTRVYAGGSYSAFLNLGSPVTIPGGATVELQFEDKPVELAVGKYDFNADLAYTANAVAVTEPESIADTLTVQPAPQLAIVSIATSQESATAGQTTPWTATMTVANNGSADIDLDFASDKTKLTFVAPGAVVDGSYIVARPTALANGDTVLVAGDTQQIVFTITQTGVLTGGVSINGRVEGTDLNQSALVSDDTFSGGRGTINIETAAAVAVTAIRTSQPAVTENQTAPWSARVVLANSGTSDVNLDLGPGRSRILFSPGAGTWSVASPTLFGGGTILEGGAVDSLLFNVTQAGDAGSKRIDAVIPFTVLNTLQEDSVTTAVSGFGSILVETAPSVRIAATNVSAPNAPEVNTGQNFGIAVEVENTGQADALGVALAMTSSGSSTVNPAPPIAVVPGGQTVLVSLPVTAVGTPVPFDTFTTAIVSATDENTDLPAIVSAALDSTAVAVVQSPALLEITNVRPSQPSVTQGQSNPWNVIVTLANTGQADVDLTPATDEDLAFSIGGATKIDYVVQAPTALSGVPGWRLAGGAVDSLVYTIVATGADAGTLDVSLGVAGADRNQPVLLLNDAGATQVLVQPAAGLAILATVSVGTVNHATANRDTVNTGFAYQMQVTVQNRGETVDSVLVNLSTDDGSQILPASFIKRSIEADSLRTFVFNVTAPAAPTPLETFTATILPGVVSHNSGEPVTPQPPVDATQVVVTETRADLVTTLVISSPPGATGGTVSTNQTFQMTALVTNTGQAGLAGPAEVFLTPPAGIDTFTVAEPRRRAFTAGQPVVWNITAPGTIQPAQNFACAIVTTPFDANTGLAAFASAASAQRPVTVSAGGALGAPDVSIISPAGAQDDTVSVSQSFTLRALVTPSADTDAVVATLTLPAGFSVVGSPVRNLGDGTGAQKQTDYSIIAPGSPGAAASVFVTFTGIDANSGDPVPSAADTVAVATVPRTSLAVSAAVTAPPDAVDNTVGVSTPFTVTASVANVAGAADIGAPGTLTITLPTGYALNGGETAAKQFMNVGNPVQWVVVSPAQPRGPDQITVAITAVPPDENSGQPAQVTTPSDAIAMLTEGSAVAVTDVSGSLGLDVGVVPGGTAGVDLLAFRIAYNATDPNVPAAEIDTIAITVVDRDGAPLTNGALTGTLKRLTIDLGGGQPYEVADPAANPIVVNLSGGGSDRIIAPNTSATAVVGLDLDSSPRVSEIRVGIRSGGLVVRDPGSGRQLGVTDGNGRPLDGQITSDPLVILSSNFEEYAHNYPNPFRAGAQPTRIAYFLDQPSSVTVRIFSLTGELVWEENIPSGDARGQAGPRETTWDGRNGSGEVVRNGVYVCVLNAGGKSAKFNIAVAK